MKINILCVGKIGEKFYSNAIGEYVKRLGRYCKLNIIEVADEKTVEGMSEHENEIIKEKEAKRLLKYIKKDDYIISLAITGKSYTSPDFAKHMEKLMTGGKSSISFIIGGSLGLHKSVLEASDEEMSFSSLTFPHQLMRVILLEQIYRAYRIINNQPYHK